MTTLQQLPDQFESPTFEPGSESYKAQLRTYDVLAPLDQRIADIRALHVGNPANAKRIEIFDRACASINRESFAELQQRYRDQLQDFHPVGPFKYFDVAFWLWARTDLALKLGIDEGPRRRILDLGTGAGHFPLICNTYGHEVVGLDVQLDVYDDLCAVLGVNRLVERIDPRKPLSDIGQFDLVTALWISFDSPRSYVFWNLEDWKFFFDDLNKHLKPGAEIYLEPNRHLIKPGVAAYDKELFEVLSRGGAEITVSYGAVYIRIRTSNGFEFAL